MMNRFTLPLDAAANGLTLGSVAFAGPQYLDGTGYAVSGFDVVAHSRQDLAPADRSRPAAVPGNSNLWRIVDGKLFLNINAAVAGFRKADSPGNLELSSGNRASFDPQSASDRPTPVFSSNALRG